MDEAVGFKDLINISIDHINKNVKAKQKIEKLTKNEWNVLQDYLVCMKPIAVALNRFQGEDEISLGYVLPVLFHTKHKFQNMLFLTPNGNKFKDSMVEYSRIVSVT